MKTPKISVHNAWAIDSRSDEGHGLIGRFWWFGNYSPSTLPAHLRGCKIALFETRKVARENLKWVRGAYPKCKEVRVVVTIEVESMSVKKPKGSWRKAKGVIAEDG